MNLSTCVLLFGERERERERESGGWGLPFFYLVFFCSEVLSRTFLPVINFFNPLYFVWISSFFQLADILFSICHQDGVILGADTRATEGPIVCDKNCEKIHYMAPNIYCCGAGTAADTEAVTGIFE